MERPTPDLAEHVAPGEPLGPTEHLARRPPREREQQDSLGRGTAAEEVRDATRERERLTAPGAGDDEERRPAMGDRLQLLGIE